jgi:hypothetical protein
MMADKRRTYIQAGPAAEPSPELARILCELESPDPATRASAVRQLCPCRGNHWELPVFPHVLKLRDDPSPVVRHAVEHDLRENPEWGERQELRRLAGWQTKRETRRVREEIETGLAEEGHPAPHSLAWRVPRRPRVRKAHYPRGRR